MQSIQLTTHIGEDGILKVEMPSEMKDTDLEIMIIFQPVPKKQGWQPGFFEEVIGGWEGEPLARGEQGDYEVREQLL